MNLKLVAKLAVGVAVVGIAGAKVVKDLWHKEVDTIEDYICNVNPSEQKDAVMYHADKELLDIAQLRDDLIERNPKMKPTADAFMMSVVLAHKMLVQFPEDNEVFDKYEALVEDTEDKMLELILDTFE